MNTLPTPEYLQLQTALAGRYSLIRELGRGGMAIVYLAQEVRLDRPVALKVMPPELAARPELRERFLREARTAARLSHPNIVPIHAVHEIGDTVLFAMSYIEGETLGEWIRARGPLTPRDATRILREVGWALAYAHAQGVIHRDVKPDNIMIEGRSGRAVVTDFGIAHVARRVDEIDSAELSGTAEFMSPEQAVGDTADERSDLYALGVVGFYMLSGRFPFQGESTAATLAKHLTQARPPLATIVPGLPATLTHAVDKCLARDPALRFANGEALAVALTQALEERREVPAALRLFLKQNRESTVSMVATEVFTLSSITIWLTLFATGTIPSEVMIMPLSVWLALASAPVAMLVQMTRRLLRAGYDREDLLRMMRDDIEEQHVELAASNAAPTRLDRWLKRTVVGGVATHLGALGMLAFGPYVPGSGAVLAGIMGVSTTAFVAAGSVAAVRNQMRGRAPGRGWLRFWESRLGRAIFKASHIKLEQLPAGAPYGPTELAIGLAADRLFDALPTHHRNAVHELPEVVKQLEGSAERMRAHIRELDSLLVEFDDATSPLALELVNTRSAAEDRLREVAAALETIRVELLKLHAGAVSVEGVTMDLRAAINLSGDVAGMLEGRREVERFLGRNAAPELSTMPTPA